MFEKNHIFVLPSNNSNIQWLLSIYLIYEFAVCVTGPFVTAIEMTLFYQGLHVYKGPDLH